MTNLGNELTDPKYNQDILYVLSHPDDEIWAAGYIAQSVENGCNVSALLISRGEGGYADPHDKTTIGDTRFEEMKKSQEILGFELLDFREYLSELGYTPEQAGAIDGKISPNNDYFIKGMIKAIRDIKPDTVLVPYERDIHPDHSNSYEASMHSLWRAERPSKLELGKPHATRKIFQYEITNLMENPTHLIDITNQWDKVKEALKCHKSQVERDNNYLLLLSYRTLTRGRGISDPIETNEKLNDIWDKQSKDSYLDADIAMKHYVDLGKRAEALKATSLRKFW